MSPAKTGFNHSTFVDCPAINCSPKKSFFKYSKFSEQNRKQRMARRPCHGAKTSRQDEADCDLADDIRRPVLSNECLHQAGGLHKS